MQKALNGVRTRRNENLSTLAGMSQSQLGRSKLKNHDWLRRKPLEFSGEAAPLLHPVKDVMLQILGRAGDSKIVIWEIILRDS